MQQIFCLPKSARLKKWKGLKAPVDRPQTSSDTVNFTANGKEHNGAACFASLRPKFGTYDVEVRPRDDKIGPKHKVPMAEAMDFFSALEGLDIFPAGTKLQEYKDGLLGGHVPKTEDHRKSYCALTVIRWIQSYSQVLWFFRQGMELEPGTPPLQALCYALARHSYNLNHSFLGTQNASFNYPLLGLAFGLMMQDHPLAQKEAPTPENKGWCYGSEYLNSKSEALALSLAAGPANGNKWFGKQGDTTQFYLRRREEQLSPTLRPLFTEKWNSAEQIQEFLKANFTEEGDANVLRQLADEEE